MLAAIKVHAERSQHFAQRENISASQTHAQAAKELGETMQALGIKMNPRAG